MTPERYCADKAAATDSDRQLALVFVSPDERPAIETLLALDSELHEIAEHAHDPAIGMARLEWWRQELAQAREGDPQHPVTRRLVELELFGNLAPEYLEEMCDAVETDLSPAGFGNFKELALYCYRSQGVTLALIEELAAGGSHDEIRAARDIGTGAQLTLLLARIGHEARKGRVYVASEDLSRHALGSETLAAESPTPPLRELLKSYADSAGAYLNRGLQVFANSGRRQHFPLIIGALAVRQLRVMRRRGFPALVEQPRSTGPARTWVAWRAARGHV